MHTDRESQRAFEARLRATIAERAIAAEHLSFDVSCHSVAEAAAAAGVTPADFIKTICMSTKDGRIVAVIMRGEDRADRSAVQALLGIGKLSIAAPTDMLERTGYPAGGTPPFGFDAIFVMDERVMTLPIVYGGGGSEFALIRAAPAALLRANNATLAPVARLVDAYAP
jgi:prolyl-tRNA editing enzyme YbaK/EbsC (Cys-tRNA(Pro) deacylase)